MSIMEKVDIATAAWQQLKGGRRGKIVIAQQRGKSSYSGAS